MFKLIHCWMRYKYKSEWLNEVFDKKVYIKKLLDSRITELTKLCDSEPLNSLCIALGIIFWAAVCFYAGLNY